jgi:hypothetical protein
MFNKTANKSWAAAWESSAPAPFSRATTVQSAAPAAEAPSGPSFGALLLSISPNEKGDRFQVRLEEPVQIGNDHFDAGQELTVGAWREEGRATTLVNVMDRIRVINCYTSPSKKEPGRIFYNCKSVQLEQSWLQACSDDAYLAQQSLLLDSKGKFILTSREVVCDPSKVAAGIRSVVIWPNDVSIVKQETNEEIPFLKFRVKYLKWTAEHVTNSTPPAPMMMEFNLWSNNCEQLVPGPLDLETWKAVMSNGLNPINFAVLCSIDPNPKYAPMGGGLSLKVHAIRADTRGYLLSPSCPLVSRQLVDKYLAKKKAHGPQPAAADASIVNVTVTGLLNAKAFPTFRALTSDPDNLTSEAAIKDAQGATVVFFAVTEQPQPLQKKPRTEKSD